MKRAFPVRSQSHQIEELSERFFRDLLPKNWVAEKPEHDYGIDLRVDLFDGDQATGLELLVQLKASARPSRGEVEVVRLKATTYNYLSDKLQVAMLVKYIESEGEAYWLLFKDIPQPQVGQKTFAVSIPKQNRLSAIEWPDIHVYVNSVTDGKLASTRRKDLSRRNERL